MIKGLKLRAGSTKFLEGNTGADLHDLGLGNGLLEHDTKSTGNQRKTKLDLVKNFYVERHYQENEKIVYQLGENICKSCPIWFKN
jgi:hypothetical protein